MTRLPSSAHDLAHHHRQILLIAVLLALALVLLMPSAAGAEQFALRVIGEQVKVAPPFATTTFRFRLIHRGSVPGSYTCRTFGDHPGQWLTALCSESQCTYDSVDVTLGPGEWEALTIDVSPFGAPGSGTLELRVRAHDPPGEMRSEHIGVISGVTRLVVDDDGGASYEDFAVSAFAASGIATGVWPAWIAAPGAGALASFTSVYWLTGDAVTSTLTDKDQAELTAFLDGRGRLLVSGQGVGPDIGGTTFYTERLGARFLDTQAASIQVLGVAGDPVGDGLSFSISGGSGANNQSSPDLIEALDEPVFQYDTGSGAGVRVEGGGVYRTVYLPFGLEGVAEAQERALLLDRIRAWLEAAPPVAVSEAGAAPPVVAAAAFPNPSPGRVRFAFTAAGGSEATAGTAPRAGGAVTVSDAGGRFIVRVPAVPAGPGLLAADWDGRTAAGMLAPRGVYFYRIELGAGREAGGRIVVMR